MDYNKRSIEKTDRPILTKEAYEATELLRLFLAGRGEKTRKAYVQDMLALGHFLQCFRLTDAIVFLIQDGQNFANRTVMAFRNQMVADEFAPATINRRIASIRSFFKMARTIGVISWSLDVENVKSQTYRDTSGPGIKVISELIARQNMESSPKGIRDLLILRLLFDLGLRRGEVAKLELSDLDMSANTITVLGKGHRELTKLTMPRLTIDALKKWLDFRGAEPGPLITNFDRAKKGKRLSGTSIYRLIKKMGLSLGKDIRPHGIRHTSITEACRSANRLGIPIEEVSRYSRHRDIRTVMIYRDWDAGVQGRLAEEVSCSVGKVKPT